MESETEKAIREEIKELRTEVRLLRRLLTVAVLVVIFPFVAMLGKAAVTLTFGLILGAFCLDRFILKPKQSKPEYDSI